MVKDVGKEDRKLTQQKQAVAGKDKSDRGDDLGVRTVQNKHNESEVTSENDFCGNESIFIFFIRILPIMGMNTCKIDC